MRLLRTLLRIPQYPVLLLPVQRGPLHGFYHFFVGYLLPAYWEMKKHPTKKYAVVDATPLNHWYSILPSSVEIVSQSAAIRIAFHARFTGYARGYRIRGLVGWDKWLLFEKRNLSAIAISIREHLARVTHSSDAETHDIVVLGRDFTPAHYAEHLPTRYGVAKRNIPNLKEAVEELKSQHDIELVDAATLSPEEVFFKCYSAKVIVAQHGAALSNIVFMKPGSLVVEIGWEEISEDNKVDMYRRLSNELGLQWIRPILQKEKFDPIQAEELKIVLISSNPEE